MGILARTENKIHIICDSINLTVFPNLATSCHLLFEESSPEGAANS